MWTKRPLQELAKQVKLWSDFPTICWTIMMLPISDKPKGIGRCQPTVTFVRVQNMDRVLMSLETTERLHRRTLFWECGVRKRSSIQKILTEPSLSLLKQCVKSCRFINRTMSSEWRNTESQNCCCFENRYNGIETVFIHANDAKTAHWGTTFFSLSLLTQSNRDKRRKTSNTLESESCNYVEIAIERRHGAVFLTATSLTYDFAMSFVWY